MRRLGLIVNPRAGRGTAANLRVARNVVDALQPVEVVTGPSQLGAEALRGWNGVVVECLAGAAAGREQTQTLAREIVGQGVDALIVVGGDGALADVALAYLELSSPPPLVGVGVGSTNVGRLITCRADSVTALDVSRLQPQAMDGVLAYCNGELLGLGFNDGVIGFTVVGTIDGRIRDLDAAERLNGRNVPGAPRSIGTPGTRVRRMGAGGSKPIAEGEAVGTVIVGFAERRFFGKAVTGGVCLAAFVGLPAGCLVADQPLVQVEITPESVMNRPPLASRYVSLDEGTRVEVEGVREGAALCADGNPLRLLGEDDCAQFAIRRAAVTVLRLAD